MTDQQSTPEADRWQSEREFFDRQAQELMPNVTPIPPSTLKRYGVLRRPYFSPEYRYRVLGDLHGKEVLDLGCGDGTNAVVLAKLGASVTGIDISAGAIEVGKQRARVNGVADRVRFVCSPIELAGFRPGQFDIIWGEAILHHLLNDLDGLLERLTTWAKPDATLLFAEPIVLSRTLRRFRMMLPVHTDATPDERPLEDGEIALVSRYLDDVDVRHFDLFGRLDRFVVTNENFEQSSAVRRAISTALRIVDYGVLSLPLVRRLAGSCVIHGRPAARRVTASRN